jgi:hypothetical protein
LAVSGPALEKGLSVYNARVGVPLAGASGTSSSFPRRCLVAISQAFAALTNTFVRLVANQASGAMREPSFFCLPPEQPVGVEQQPHRDSHASS